MIKNLTPYSIILETNENLAILNSRHLKLINLKLDEVKLEKLLNQIFIIMKLKIF